MTRKNTCVVWEYKALGGGWSWRLTGMPLVCLDPGEAGESWQRLWNPTSCEKPWTVWVWAGAAQPKGCEKKQTEEEVEETQETCSCEGANKQR